jgi:hypothetical protein
MAKAEVKEARAAMFSDRTIPAGFVHVKWAAVNVRVE